ncbi:protein FAM53A-like [Antedon mediterranea]|uniref:protein FAM53A-like n=1 Tax=Antedon mediterranea TaxID=105859 RepID=UPI003AF9BB34
MVTLITEKLQNQSLEDVNIPEYPHIAYHTRSRTKAWQLSHNKIDSRTYTDSFTATNSKSCAYSTEMPVAEYYALSKPCQIPSNQNEVDRNNSINSSQARTPTAAPPKKRHCRSLSAGELTEQRAYPWKPRASRVWRPVTKAKLDTYQGHVPMHNFNLPSLENNYPIFQYPELENEYSTPPESPVPRPASATSWDDSLNMPWLDANSLHHQIAQKSWFCSEDKISESSGSVVSIPSVSLTPELQRKGVGMLRCRSQPCVSRRRGGKKRRREEESRPKLDFQKMEETSYNRCTQKPKKTSKQRGMLNCTETERFLGLKTIASSPCDGNHASSIMITPTSSPTKELEKSDDAQAADSSTSDDDYSGNEFEDTLEDIIFPIDPDDELDLDEIENN